MWAAAGKLGEMTELWRSKNRCCLTEKSRMPTLTYPLALLYGKQKGSQVLSRFANFRYPKGSGIGNNHPVKQNTHSLFKQVISHFFTRDEWNQVVKSLQKQNARLQERWKAEGRPQRPLTQDSQLCPPGSQCRFRRLAFVHGVVRELGIDNLQVILAGISCPDDRVPWPGCGKRWDRVKIVADKKENKDLRFWVGGSLEFWPQFTLHPTPLEHTKWQMYCIIFIPHLSHTLGGNPGGLRYQIKINI